MKTLPQRCPLPFIYLSWVALLGGTAYWLATGRPWMAGAWAVALVAGEWAYLRLFPRISRFLGYGRVDDRSPDPPRHDAAGASGTTSRPPDPPRVTLYTALGCPFCPIVEERLEKLRDRLGFELEVVDVTLKPDLLRAKGIRAVPVVEVGERRIARAATTAELLAHITGVAAGEEAAASVSGA